jgi:hypothetical protein
MQTVRVRFPRMRYILNWFFSRDCGPQSPWQVILWWETRRFPYNVIIGVAGLISLPLFFLFADASGKIEPGVDVVEPLMLLVSPIIANIAYSAGWAVELVFRCFLRDGNTPGPLFLKLGVIFSVLVIAAPTAIWFCIWLFSLI